MREVINTGKMGSLSEKFFKHELRKKMKNKQQYF